MKQKLGSCLADRLIQSTVFKVSRLMKNKKTLPKHNIDTFIFLASENWSVSQVDLAQNQLSCCKDCCTSPTVPLINKCYLKLKPTPPIQEIKNTDRKQVLCSSYLSQRF